MAFTQAQLETLEEAIASGATEVRMGDRKIVYREDMGALRKEMQQELGVSTVRRQRGVVNPVTNKGL